MQGVLRSFFALSLLASGCHLVFPHNPGGDARVDRTMAGLDALPLDVSRLGEGILLPADGGAGADAAADAGVHDAGLPPGPFCKAQQPYLYCNDFDSSIAGWSADGTTGPGFIDAKPADWGGTNDEYWSPDLGDGDRSLTFYKSSNTSTARWRIALTNPYPYPIKAISISFTVEVPWVRFQGVDSKAPEYGLRFARVSTTSVAKTGDTSTLHGAPLDNMKVSNAERARWLTRAERTALSLRLPSTTYSATLPVGPGESFTLALERDGYAPADEENMNVGIDDLVVRGVP